MDRADKRYRKAGEQIRQAFMELLEKKGFEQITATDVIKQADVNRTTFYAHYRDKYDLLEDAEDTFWEPLFGYIRTQIEPGMDIMKVLPIVVEQAAKYYYENKKALMLFVGENGDPHFWTRFSNNAQKLINETPVGKQLKIPSEYVVASFVGSISNMLMAWAKNDFREPPEEFAKIVYTIAKGAAENVISAHT